MMTATSNNGFKQRFESLCHNNIDRMSLANDNWQLNKLFVMDENVFNICILLNIHSVGFQN